MIRKLIQRINEWLEYRLRLLCAPLSPDARVIVILSMLLVFGAGSIYITVSSIYNFGKDKGQRMYMEHIETLKLQPQEFKKDSIINQLKEYYNGTAEFE